MAHGTAELWQRVETDIVAQNAVLTLIYTDVSFDGFLHRCLAPKLKKIGKYIQILTLSLLLWRDADGKRHKVRVVPATEPPGDPGVQADHVILCLDKLKDKESYMVQVLAKLHGLAESSIWTCPASSWTPSVTLEEKLEAIESRKV